jgi:hypothetical protein
MATPPLSRKRCPSSPTHSSAPRRTIVLTQRRSRSAAMPRSTLATGLTTGPTTGTTPVAETGPAPATTGFWARHRARLPAPQVRTRNGGRRVVELDPLPFPCVAGAEAPRNGPMRVAGGASRRENRNGTWASATEGKLAGRRGDCRLAWLSARGRSGSTPRLGWKRGSGRGSWRRVSMRCRAQCNRRTLDKGLGST